MPFRLNFTYGLFIMKTLAHLSLKQFILWVSCVTDHERGRRPLTSLLKDFRCEYRQMKMKICSGSSASRQIPMPQPVAPETRGDTPNNPGTYPQNVQSGEITPTRTLRERLGPTSAGTTSGSKEQRSALARISEPPATTEQPARRTPSFESGRLQHNDNRATEATTDQGNMEPLSEERLPATLRLGSSITAPPTRRGVIPIAPQSKAAGKRKELAMQCPVD
ncbi:hypothetical protein Bca4012_099168 [Brassica carinata]|uniref:BnaC06g12150D protein n=1 Tax=Brassica napus TaxID=3708 RepID=A0A078GP44_BRANA|nr:BnaC06g12150D [Brassica napus]